MSRLEEALEKAALLRNSLAEAASEAIRPAEKKIIPVRPANSPSSPPAALPLHAEKPDNPLLVTVNEPHSPIAEEYRKLKNVLLTLTRQERFNNVIMVTSSVGREGKSITSLNLAITLAQEFDHTVLLVDADLKKPSIHGYLGMEPKLGLSDCLLGGADIGEAIISTGISGLSMLPAGKAIQNSAEHFSSQNMKDLVQELKNRYPDRYVIIDTPPVLPFADVHSLSTFVDGVIFVVKEGMASQHEVKKALHELKSANLLGVVFNEASVEASNSRYYYYGYGADTGSRATGRNPQKKSLLDRLFRRK